MTDAQTKTFVTKDMPIGEVVAKYPQAAAVMTSYGLHCVGCGISPFETIEGGFKGHDKDLKNLDKMVSEINAAIADAQDGDEYVPKKTDKIELTAAAARQIKMLMESEGSKGGLRINLLPGGCSGFMYSMQFTDETFPEDVVVESQGVKLFVLASYMKNLAGTTIDFVQTLNESGFTFNNPNASSVCGCGKSFG